MNHFCLTLDAPIIEVLYVADTVTCTSDANPTANEHVIIINGTYQFTPTCSDNTCTLPLKVNLDTEIRCNAANTVGTGTAAILAVPGKLN